MAGIEDIVGALQSVIDELSDAETATGTAVTETDETIAIFLSVGGTASAEALSATKDTMDKLSQQIQAAIDAANDAIEQAKAAAGT